MTLRDPWGYAGKTYDDTEMRMLVAALSGGRGGVASTTDLAISAQGSPGPTVRMAAGYAAIPATAAGERGAYAVENDASLNSAAITATGGLPRWDVLILRVVAGVAAIEVVQGTANASPTEPSLAAKDNYIRLARIQIPASTTNITNAMIVDQRPLLESPHVCTSTTKPGTPFDGEMIWLTDTTPPRLEIWIAATSEWRPKSPFVGLAGAFPTAPPDGYVAYATDNNLPTGAAIPSSTAVPVGPGLYVYDGGRYDPPWNMPWGIMDYQEITADSAAHSAETDVITGHAVTYRANRRIRVRAFWRGLSATTTDCLGIVAVKEGATQLAETDVRIVDAAVAQGGGSCEKILSPSAGAHTYKVTSRRALGSGNITFSATATGAAFLVVEDIGPNGQPA